MSDMMPNATQVYERTKRRWIEQHNTHLSPQEWFVRLLPLFLFIIQVSFFILSASHTVEMINRVSHNVGAAAAIGFELGLIVLSYMMYVSRKRGQVMPIWWTALEVIIFIMIVGANFGGAIAAVLETTKVQSLSAAAILAGFGNLSLNDQIALALAVMFSISVPIGSVVVGQAVAHLLLDSEANGSPLEAKWERCAWKELYAAFYAAAVDAGAKPQDARVAAVRMASGFTNNSKPKDEPVPLSVPERSGPHFQVIAERSSVAAQEMPTGESNNSIPVSGSPVENSTKRIIGAYESAMEAFRSGKSVKEVIDSKIAGKSTAYKAWADFQGAKNE